ncbi:MAG TPA: hypothetical protein VHE81_14500 [Lacipirellulaceae bacterium]|nr:hypothetical protein [Lacipirellulaceae bacterium]
MGERIAPRLYSPIYLVMAAWLLPTAGMFADGPADNLQQLVNDTAAQVQLAYRQLPNERDRRQAKLDSVVAAWRASNRDQASNERLATWLHTAILNSMPGSTKPLPPAPTFAASDKSVLHAAASVERKTPPVSDGKLDDDPFRDDPASESK